MTTRTFEYEDGTSRKFWSITCDGDTCAVRFGRIGTDGQSQSKSYPGPGEAQAAAEKQIAEKLRKGYREVGAPPDPLASAAQPATPAAPPMARSAPVAPPTAPAAPAAAAASPTTPAPAAEVPAHQPAVAAAPPLGADPAGVRLDPADWLWATWRATPALPMPEPRPFDRDAALARLAQMPAPQHGWMWGWDLLQLSPAMSREEAAFWLAVMSSVGGRPSPKDLMQRVRALPRGADSGKADVVAGIVALGNLLRPEMVLPIAALLGADGLVDLILDPAIQPVGRKGATYPTFALIDGFRRFLLPYLSAEERAQLAGRFAPDPASWPTEHNISVPPVFYLAAMLGGHGDALLAVVEGWADDAYTGEGRNDHYHRPQEIVLGLADPALAERHMRRLKLRLGEPGFVRGWLAHTGLSALDVPAGTILAVANRDDATALAEVLALAVGPEAAPHMLALLLESKVPHVARAWLDSHPAHAIAGLAPVAVGRGRLAEQAANVLRRYVRRGLGAQVEAAAAALTADAAARLRAATREPAADLPEVGDSDAPAWLSGAPEAGRKALPAWVAPGDLPALRVGDRRLGRRHVEALVRALQGSTLEAPHPLAAAAREHVDPASRDAFAWALFEEWLAQGGPSREGWALAAVGILGGDSSALRLAALVREWPGQSQHQRAVQGLEALRALGSDAALMQISGIARKVKFKALQERAGQCLERIAAERGLSREQLEDRVVPDCDLDARGERTFDFGPRQFRFALGPELRPMLRDAAGALRPDLPKPSAKDDAALAAQAADEWKLLKRQVAEVAKVQSGRLEQAMVTGRRWPADEFARLIVGHPLMVHLARTLVWQAYDAAGAQAGTFRVTEDSALFDSADSPFALPAGASVGVAHPLNLAAEEAAAWGDLMGDYGIAPPFPQLGRPVLRLEPGELEAREVARFRGAKIPAAALVFGLDKLGWRRDAPADGGGFSGHSKPFHQAGVTAVVQYSDGVAVGWIVDAPDQQVDYVAFVPGVRQPEWWPTHKDRLPLGEVDPVVVSEVLNDLAAIFERSK